MRVIVRPSGTEPKVKAYVEVVDAPAGADGLAASRAVMAALLERCAARRRDEPGADQLVATISAVSAA